MPLRKYCASPECNKVIDINKTYCSKHAVTKAQRDKEYDTKYRDQKAKAFYNSKAWRLTREIEEKSVRILGKVIENRSKF